MDELYGIHSVLAPSTSNNNNNNGVDDDDHQQTSKGAGSEMMSDVVKAQIATHPLYPAYIHCTKVAAPPEMASLVEEISKVTTTTQIGDDPELDEFMESYCQVLYKYKQELSKPFDEAKTFLTSIESQLNNLCTLPTTSYHSSVFSDEALSEEDLSCGEVEAVAEREENCEGEEQIKEMLMRKYSGYLSSLRKEFLKKRKKGILLNDARLALLHWWNSHYRKRRRISYQRRQGWIKSKPKEAALEAISRYAFCPYGRGKRRRCRIHLL